jgi:hypothetical protein
MALGGGAGMEVGILVRQFAHHTPGDADMDTLLRRLAEWKGRRRAAQVIVFDGGAEVETTRAFAKGALSGIGVTLLIFLLTAPTITDSSSVAELERREHLLREANDRTNQAMSVARVCLATAEHLEQTLESYQAFLGSSAK